MKIGDAIRNSNICKTEARSLMRAITGFEIPYIIANEEVQLGEEERKNFINISQRRGSGQPMGYLLREKEFFGSVFMIGREVLIPRPETELLVELVLISLRDRRSPKLLELGTGSGAIAISLLLNHFTVMVTAIDVSGPALRLARENAIRLLNDLTRIEFIESDWYAEVLKKANYDVIVANPPYVPDGDVHLTKGDLRFEPSIALLGGSDGLSHIRKIVGNAGDYLVDNGWLILEHGFDQSKDIKKIFEINGYQHITQKKDLAGSLRVTVGRLKKPIDYK